MSTITTTWSYGNWQDKASLDYVPANEAKQIKGRKMYTTAFGALAQRPNTLTEPGSLRRPYKIQQGTYTYITYDPDPAVIFRIQGL